MTSSSMRWVTGSVRFTLAFLPFLIGSKMA
jgi:hypothetical protein